MPDCPLVGLMWVTHTHTQWYVETTTRGMATRAHFYANDGALAVQPQPGPPRGSADGDGRHVSLHWAKNQWDQNKDLTIMPMAPTINISTAAYKQPVHGGGWGHVLGMQKCCISCPALCKTTLQV